MAFIYFARHPTDVAVIEVGLGGRLDATNVSRRWSSLITTISKDHEAFLGTDLLSIAGEKAGIIKPEYRWSAVRCRRRLHELLPSQDDVAN